MNSHRGTLFPPFRARAASASGLGPQNFKVLTRLQDFGIRDGANGDVAGNPANINFRLEVVPHGNSGQCTLQSDAPQDKTVAAWRTDPDDVFTFRVSNSGNDQLAWCHLEPKITEVADQDVTLPLWNDWIIYDDGQRGSIASKSRGTCPGWSATTTTTMGRSRWRTPSSPWPGGSPTGSSTRRGSARRAGSTSCLAARDRPARVGGIVVPAHPGFGVTGRCRSPVGTVAT
ncbi:hypothetical protein AB0M44_38295 [Streptosporangium subroseum]|uniref:hypothetical protein n=1 Tax=Streptosporangium subroseum TaxID=106412 RepID=UPI00342ABA5E